MLSGGKEPVSAGRPDAPERPSPSPRQAQAVARLFLGQALARTPLSSLMYTRICESMNVTLTRSVFDDRSESAWHVL